MFWTNFFFFFKYCSPAVFLELYQLPCSQVAQSWQNIPASGILALVGTQKYQNFEAPTVQIQLKFEGGTPNSVSSVFP